MHAVTAVAKGVVLLDLRAAEDASPLVAFDAGAHIDLHLGERIVRQYSLVEENIEAHRYLICVRRDEKGRGGSLAVHERVSVGDVLEVSAPRNTFALRDADSSAILLAGGVGITPLVTMASRLHQRGIPFSLHAYSRNAEELPLRELLERSAYRERVTTHFSDEGDSFRTDFPRELTTPSASGSVYACGPDAFVDLARERAKQAGWMPEQVVSERFSMDPSAAPETGGRFTVIATSTGQAFEVGPEQSIADVLERNGFETYRSCGQGYCGSCVTRVIAGMPDHRDSFQSDSEHALNQQINVCCSRSVSPVLELDI